RPSKRAKTEDAQDAPVASTSSASTSTNSDVLTLARQNHILGAIRSLRRSKDARPFSMSVDTVKLNIPHYYQIITSPMDLQTMERKLTGNEYQGIAEIQ